MFKKVLDFVSNNTGVLFLYLLFFVHIFTNHAFAIVPLVGIIMLTEIKSYLKAP